MSIGYSDSDERAYREDLRRDDVRRRQRENHRRHADPFCGCPICEPDSFEEPWDDETEDDA